MRTLHTPAVFLGGMLLAATGAFGQIKRDQAVSPCRLLVQAIDRNSTALDNGLERLVELARLSGDQDRERIAQAREQFIQRRDELAARYEMVIANVDLSNEESLAEACLTIRPKLVEIRDRLVTAVQEMVALETRARTAIANARRVGFAVRTTDQTLFRAARLAAKTDNGVEAFPGLRRAFELQEQAKQALAASRFEAAMKTTLAARDLVGRTIKAALDSADVAAVRERAMDFWKQTERMIARIEGEISVESTPRAARLLDMAKQEQERARELASEQPYRALRHGRAARRIVNEMIAFHRRSANCEERGRHLTDRMDQAREIVGESEDAKAGQLLERAIGHYERGVALCTEGKPAEATVQFDIAAKLGAKAVDLAKGNTAGSRALQAEIRKTDMIVRRAEQAAETDAQKKLTENARKLVEEARNSTGDAQTVLKLLDRATDLAFQVIGRSLRQDNDE